MKRITEIAPMSAAQFGAFLYGLVGILAMVVALFSEEKSLYAPLGLLLPYFSVKLDFTFRSVQLLFAPLMYAASGAISFSFAALIYNIFAGMMGGLRIGVREGTAFRFPPVGAFARAEAQTYNLRFKQGAADAL